MYFLGESPKSFRGIEAYSHLNYKNLLFGIDDGVENLKTIISSKQVPLQNQLYFSPNLDFSQLITSVSKKITRMNPRFFNGLRIYNVNLEFSIGNLDGEDIYGVLVKTTLIGDKIIGIYPADFSSHFDKEGLSTSEDLRKRLKIK